MLKELNIALFADADNCGLEYSHFDNTLFQLNEMGNVVYGKIYGVSDRKHKEIINDINKFGFDMAPVMRVKKRGSKVFDNRILIDVMDEVLQTAISTRYASSPRARTWCLFTADCTSWALK